MRRSLRLAACMGVFAVALASAGSAAADENDARSALALDLFEKSEAAYDAGRFADAIALLRRSYALKREPVLLYNLGRAYEGLGDLGAAAQAYEGFLAAQPNTPDRGALERRIATLRRQLAERDMLRRKAIERERQERRSPSAVPWVVAGAGALGVAAGAVVSVMATQRNDDAKTEPTYVEAERLHSQATTFATVANVCFVAGAVIVVTGVIWGIVDVSGSKKPASTALTGTFVF